jgi:hypothetical protein
MFRETGHGCLGTGFMKAFIARQRGAERDLSVQLSSYLLHLARRDRHPEILGIDL